MAALRNAAALCRARALPSSATESSRSTMRASAPLVIALSSFLALSAGTKSKERIGHPCHSGAARSEEPGVHNHDGRNCTLPQVSFAQGVWIPDLRLRATPLAAIRKDEVTSAASQ